MSSEITIIIEFIITTDMPNFFATLSNFTSSADLYSRLYKSDYFQQLNKEITAHGFGETVVKTINNTLLMLTDPIAKPYVESKENNKIFKSKVSRLVMTKTYLSGLFLHMLSNNGLFEFTNPDLPFKVATTVNNMSDTLTELIDNEEPLTGRKLYLMMVEWISRQLMMFLKQHWDDLNSENPHTFVAELVNMLLSVVIGTLSYETSVRDTNSDDSDSDSGESSDEEEPPRLTDKPSTVTTTTISTNKRDRNEEKDEDKKDDDTDDTKPKNKRTRC